MPPVGAQSAPDDHRTQECRERHYAGAHQDYDAGQRIPARGSTIFWIATAATAVKIVELGWRRSALSRPRLCQHAHTVVYAFWSPRMIGPRWPFRPKKRKRRREFDLPP